MKVVPLPEGLDPDDVIKQRGTEGYQACLDAAMPLIDYKLSVLGRGFDLNKTEDKRRYVAEALDIIRTAESAAESEELLKQLRDKSGISLEALKRDLEAKPRQQEAKSEPPPERKDSADVIKKASRFVLSAFLFGADCVDGTDIEDVDFKDEVHEVIARYIRTKKLMDEPVRLSELFEFFDEKTPEYEELTRILDYSEGGGFTGEVAEKYFADCLMRLKLDGIDGEIAEATKRLDAADDLHKRAEIAQRIVELTKQREKIKNGANV